MVATLRLPANLRPFAQDRSLVKVEGATVREALEDLERQCPGLLARLLDERGAVRRYVNLFLNDEDVRFLSGLDTKVAEGDLLTVIPAIAGGA
ncbi:MAG: ubiquitin-like small modifier protein 1 [Myxococcaceae bacterium]